MKTTLFSLFFLLCAWAVGAQAPVIEGDLILCPYTNGTATITNDETYDTYQWYSKYWFTNDEYVAIEGATSSSFTYDWFTYDQSLFKVVVTKGSETYESNIIQIDSYQWSGLLILNELQGNIHFEFDEETLEQKYVMCHGAKLLQTVLEPYVTAQWYKDGVAIEGATSLTYTITEPGTYYAIAGVEVCPDATSKSPDVTVVYSENCGPDTPSPLVIQGDTALCPETNGLAFVTNAVAYDTYQWYAKFEGATEFEVIENATVASFVYAAEDYDQATLLAEVTKDGITYESNTILVERYDLAPLSIDITLSEGVVTETPAYRICEGDNLTFTIEGEEEDFINIQWFKDGLPIGEANGMTYTATEPGVYHLDAALVVCTNNIMSTYETPINVLAKEDCFLGINNPELANSAKIYPNPANSILNIALPENSPIQEYSIMDVTGKLLSNGKIDLSGTAINVESLSSGTYFVKLTGSQVQAVKMFVKN